MAVGDPFHRPGWVYKEKVDGWRMLAFKDGDVGRLVSRNGVDSVATALAEGDAGRANMAKQIPEESARRSSPQGTARETGVGPGTSHDAHQAA